MKKIIQIVGLLIFVLSVNSSFAQDKTQIRKEVKVEEKNGEKMMTIITEENGKTTEEVYKGAEVDTKLAELQNMEMSEVETEDVKVEHINGEKTVTITRKSKDQETIEVLKGEAADAKLKEMEGEPMNQPKPLKTVKKTEIKKVERIEKN